MKKYIDFSFDKLNYLAFAVVILSFIWVKIFNISEILENSIYENIAIIPLIAGIFLCFKSKNHKTFFRFIALILILVIAREFNYGRVPFCAVPGTQGHLFYPWSHYKYGFLANIFVGLYIVSAFLYALINKIWLDIIEIFKKVQIPFYSFIMAIICVFIQLYSEHALENTIIEEITESVIYTLTFIIIFIYYKKINTEQIQK